MSQGNVPITPEGHQRHTDELKQLKTVARPKVIQEIATAREHGDLRENAEYHAAKEKQGFIEGRIAELESILGRVDIIDTSRLSGRKVTFGATVRISNADTGEEVTYRIVGPSEADIARGSISIASPIAKQLIGREVGDEVSVKTPGGLRSYELLEVSFQG